MDLCSNDIEGPPILIRQILHQRLGRLMIQLARQGADVVVSVLHVELLSAEAQIPDVHLGDLYAESGQTVQGSFSAVSKPKFASKFSLE